MTNSNIPPDLLFTKEHEWIRLEGETATVGISDHAQAALGDITFVELPTVGDKAIQFQTMATIESVKAASDVYAPLTGTNLAINENLETNPALINQSCYTDGWIVKIKTADLSEKEKLMNAEKYKEYLEGLEH